jgi:hypothetical protein
VGSALWRRIKRYVDLGVEAPKVDLKQTLDLSSRDRRAEFVKDVTAIANTPGGDGYLILGVLDNSRCPRDSSRPEDYVVGFSPPDPDELLRQMVDALSLFCDPVPDVEYEQVTHPETGRTVGVITVKRSSKRPHKIIRSGSGVESHDVFVRRGTATYKATPEEIGEMFEARSTRPLPEVIVINLSGRSLTSRQREQLGREVYIEELIELPVHFDAYRDLAPQVEKIIDDTGLAPEEWSNRNIYLVLPGIAPGAAAFLAAVHGLRGGFPKVVWIYQSPDDHTQYQVAQVVDLQALRDLWDKARKVRTV